MTSRIRPIWFSHSPWLGLNTRALRLRTLPPLLLSSPRKLSKNYSAMAAPSPDAEIVIREVRHHFQLLLHFVLHV